MCCGKNRQQMQTTLRKGAPSQPGPSPVPVAPTAPSPSNRPHLSSPPAADKRPQFWNGLRRSLTQFDRMRRPL
jgi:hypothetical protein